MGDAKNIIMKTYLVIVACLHIKECPLPEGYKTDYPNTTKEQCIATAKDVIRAYGYQVKDFSIRCEVK